MQKVRTKAELLRIMPRFFKDKKRGISVRLFAEVCGLSDRTLLDVFVHQIEPLSERTQIRVDRALNHFINGEIAVLEHKWYGTRRVEYRKEPKPVARKTYKLTVKDGQIGLKVGLVPKGDYSDPSLDELLK